MLHLELQDSGEGLVPGGPVKQTEVVLNVLLRSRSADCLHLQS